MARLDPITSTAQLAPENQGVGEAVIKSRGAIQGPFTMLLHCPPLAAHMVNLGGYVRFEGTLDMKVRVLAAMTVARELDALYVWGAQTGSARRQGVPEETIAAIREKHARGIAPEDAQIVDFTRQLLRKHRVDDATAGALLARLGHEQFIELTGTIGYYSALAMVVNACELEPAPGAEVLQT
jgi:4-carboxymuconolactone decarboxylase